MTLNEFRRRLAAALDGCSPDEIESAVEYYTELIEESDDPAAQMMKLGSPEELAERIKRESGWIQPSDGIAAGGGTPPPPPPQQHGIPGAQGYGRQSFSGQNFSARQNYAAGGYAGAGQSVGSGDSAAVARIIALIATFPFWLAAFIIMGSLFIVIWSIFGAFAGGALSGLVGGLVEMRNYFSYGLLILAATLVFAGLTMLFLNCAINLTRLNAYSIAGLARVLFSTGSKGRQFKWKKMNSATVFFSVVLLAIGIMSATAVYVVARPTGDKYAQKMGFGDIEYTLYDGVENLSVDIMVGDIKIKRSDGDVARLIATNILEDKLTVVHDGDRDMSITYMPSNEMIGGFDFDLFGIKSRSIAETTFELYLPKEQYERLSIEADLGRVTVEKMNAGELSIECDCGEIDISGGSFGMLKIKELMGAVEIKNVTAETADIENDCGAVNMESVSIDGRLTADLSLGEANLSYVTVDNMDMQLDCGDFNFKGEVLGSGSEISLDLGSADIKLNGSGYDVYGTTDLGDVSIDSKLVGGSKRINITNDCGDINVKER